MIPFAQPRIPAGLMRDMVDLNATGSYDQNQGGQWVPGEMSPETFKGTIMPMSNSLQYSLGGTHSANAKILYTNGHTLTPGAQFMDPLDGSTYTIKEDLDHTPIHGIKRYVVEKKGGSKPK